MAYPEGSAFNAGHAKVASSAKSQGKDHKANEAGFNGGLGIHHRSVRLLYEPAGHPEESGCANAGHDVCSGEDSLSKHPAMSIPRFNSAAPPSNDTRPALLGISKARQASLLLANLMHSVYRTLSKARASHLLPSS